MTLKVDIYGKNIDLNDRMHDYVSKKVSKLDRYLTEIEEARVDLGYNKSARNAADRYVAQITIRGRGFILRSEERADDIYAGVDTALDKMQRRIERYKGKHFHGRGNGKSSIKLIEQSDEEEIEAEQPIITRRKHFILTPMDEAEAIEQMELLGHENFFVFLNVGTNTINVLYQRRDGSYGLIEPEIG